MVVLDTNIIIDHLRLNQTRQSVLQKLIDISLDKDLAISVISLQELYTRQSTRILQNELYMLSVLSKIKVLSYNNEVSKFAGKLCRDSKLNISFADCAIASTAILNNSPLLTLNTKHFNGIDGLELFEFE